MPVYLGEMCIVIFTRWCPTLAALPESGKPNEIRFLRTPERGSGSGGACRSRLRWGERDQDRNPLGSGSDCAA